MNFCILAGMQYMLHGGNGVMGVGTCRGMRFYIHSLFGRPSGGSIFRCTTKDRGERRAKGIAIPLNPLGLMCWAILTCFVRTVPQRCV